MEYLLDTNICIYIIKKKPAEVFEKFLTPIEIIDYGYEATLEYGKIRAELEKKGTPIGPLDMLIASHAKSLNPTCS
jgi:tRNA(fMet)-specific endonuclease VapC